jgi:hypothetical protein
LGIPVELASPDVPLLVLAAPLRRPTLHAALLELAGRLIPDTSPPEGRTPDVTFVFGASECSDRAAVRVTATSLTCHLQAGAEPLGSIAGELPFGAMAAAAAAAAIALDTALPAIERETLAERSARPRPSTGPPVNIDLAPLFSRLVDGSRTLGALDVVSGGAITSALMAVLLWVPDIAGKIRVIEGGACDLTNLNRYMQLRADEEEPPKVEHLASCSTPTLEITGVERHFTKDTREEILPFATRVVVGVDDIQARWWVQEEWPEQLFVGATNNHEALLTTHHPGGACAGCAHPDPLPDTGDEFIPTISFVSFWAGLLQACALHAPPEQPARARRITVYPFGLGEPGWCTAGGLPAGARCAIGCPLSASANLGAEARR